MTAVMAIPAAQLLPTKSFQGSSLTMSAADFGGYSTSKIAHSFWMKLTTTGVTSIGTIFNADGSAVINFTQIDSTHIALQAISYHDSGASLYNQYISASLAVNSTLQSWTHFLVHFDPLNATANSRIKVWINGSADSASSSSLTQNSAIYATTTTITENGLNSNVLVYQPCFFSGSLPSISQLYNNGHALDVRGISGAYSYIDTTGDNITNDYFLTPNWTNSSVSLSSTIPT